MFGYLGWGYVLVVLAGALVIMGAFVLNDSVAILVVVPLLLLVLVLAFVVDAILGARNSDD